MVQGLRPLIGYLDLQDEATRVLLAPHHLADARMAPRARDGLAAKLLAALAADVDGAGLLGPLVVVLGRALAEQSDGRARR